MLHYVDSRIECATFIYFIVHLLFVVWDFKTAEQHALACAKCHN